MQFLVALSLTLHLQLQTPIADLITTLDEAEAYLVVNPAHSLTLLAQPVFGNDTPPELKLRHAVLTTRAAVPTNQLDKVIIAVDDAFQYVELPAFKQHLTALTSALGIWLRRNQYLLEAKQSLECAVKHATSTRQQLTLLNSLGLVARQLDDNALAKQLFSHVQLLAEQSELPGLVAIASNNLGLLALDEGNIKAAEPHLRAALKQYQLLNQRAGIISAGINLLFYFVLQNEETNFVRLYTPTETLTKSFPNEAKQALLDWLRLAFQHNKGFLLSDAQKSALADSFSKLEDIKVQQQVARYLAPKLGVPVSHLMLPAQHPKAFDRPWFHYVAQCAWPAEAELPAQAFTQ